MKIIDLLNKIANDEDAPKKIRYKKETYYLEKRHYVDDSYTDLFENNIYAEILNDEVEIIEEPKKINKIRIDYNSINIDKAFETGTTTFFREKDIAIFQCLSSKINEIIDKINEVE